MKFLLCVLLLCSSWNLRAELPGWPKDVNRAFAEAREEKKQVLLCFTKSNLIGNCKLFREKVLKAPEFTAYSKTNLVILEVDLADTRELTDQDKATESRLLSRYQVESVPALVLFNEDRKWVTTIHYQQQSVPALLSQLEKFAAKGVQENRPPKKSDSCRNSYRRRHRLGAFPSSRL